MTHTQLEYKLVDKSGQFIKMDLFYPSSKTYGSCGDEKPMPLNIRTYDCSCVLVLDGDVNAALNIRREAIEKLNRVGKVQIKARGDAAHSFTAYHVTSDASSNRDEFLSTRVLETESYLDSR